MRTPHQLTRDELETIVTSLQQELYLDTDPQFGMLWNPNKAWNGADICGELAALLALQELVPESLTPVDPNSRRSGA
jgi:hypothetical protein